MGLIDRLRSRLAPRRGVRDSVARTRQVFISYVKEDGKLAALLAENLEAEGYSCWYYERDTVVSLDFREQIVQALRNGQALIAVISRSSMSSDYVDKELFYAADTRMPIIPLLYGIRFDQVRDRSPQWSFILAGTSAKRVDLRNIPEATAQVVAGLKALGILPGRSAPSPNPEARAELTASSKSDEVEPGGAGWNDSRRQPAKPTDPVAIVTPEPPASGSQHTSGGRIIREGGAIEEFLAFKFHGHDDNNRRLKFAFDEDGRSVREVEAQTVSRVRFQGGSKKYENGAYVKNVWRKATIFTLEGRTLENVHIESYQSGGWGWQYRTDAYVGDIDDAVVEIHFYRPPQSIQEYRQSTRCS